MKRLVHLLSPGRIIAAIILAFVLAGRASEKPEVAPALDTAGKDLLSENASQNEATTELNIDSHGVILKGCDAVAYFKETKPVKGDATFISTYRGATYLFASAANKADFDKEPEKYVPQYGGFCAYGMASGVLADPEGPGAFTIYKGKLYFCGNQGALKSFRSDIDNNIDKADKNWRQLTGS
jgi:YHS domain-containing protein